MPTPELTISGKSWGYVVLSCHPDDDDIPTEIATPLICGEQAQYERNLGWVPLSVRMLLICNMPSMSGESSIPYRFELQAQTRTVYMVKDRPALQYTTAAGELYIRGATKHYTLASILPEPPKASWSKSDGVVRAPDFTAWWI